MLLYKLLAPLSAASLVAANTITFVSLDEHDRTIFSKHKTKCTNDDHGLCSDVSLADIAPVNVPGLAQINVELPSGWEGNFYSVPGGTPDRTGMLAEIRSQGFENGSYYDVSAIENPNDNVGVKQFWPAHDPNAEVSGCIQFPCPYTYYHPNDLQTKPATWSDKFYCTLGNADLSKNPHLAQWHMVYDHEKKKWAPLSA